MAPPKNNARGPAGGRTRAQLALLGLERSDKINAMKEPRLFWSVRLNTEPPPLRQTFGNFSTINNVTRINLNLDAATDQIIWMPWTASGMAAFVIPLPSGVPTTTAVTQVLYTVYNASPPQAVRPLRMSVSVANETAAINRSGEMLVLSYDNSLTTDFFFPPVNTNAATIGSATVNSFLDLVQAAPETTRATAEDLAHSKEYVSIPAAWPRYNTYYDFVPMTNTTQYSSLQGGDLYSLTAVENSAITVGALGQARPYPTFVSGSNDYVVSSVWGDVPPMRGFLFYLKRQASVQNYAFTFRRQDGARFPANTLGHLFHKSAKPGSVDHENKMLSGSHTISQGPSIPLGVSEGMGDMMHRAEAIGDAMIGDVRGAASAIGAEMASILQPRRGYQVPRGRSRARPRARAVSAAPAVRRTGRRGLRT